MKNKTLYFSILLCTVFQNSFSQSGKSIPNSDSLLISYKKQWRNPKSNTNQKAEALKSIVNSYFQNQSSIDSFNHYCDLYIQFSVNNQNSQHFSDAYFLKTNAKRTQADWIGLIKTGQEALHLVDSLKIKQTAFQKSIYVDEMIYGYIFLNDLENVVKYGSNTILALKKENKDGKNDLQISMLYLTLARGNGHLTRFEKAEKYLDSSLIFIKKTDEILKKYYILNDVASIKIDTKQYEKALPVALDCFTYFEKIPDNRGFPEILMLLGRTYLGLKDYEKAITFSNKSLLKKTKNVRILYRDYQTLYHAYKAKNQSANALFAHEKYIEFHEKLFNEKFAYEKSVLEKRFAEEKGEVLLNKEKAEVLLQKKYKNYFIGGAILLTLISIGLFFNRKLLQTQKKKVEAQKNVIEELNEHLEEKVKERTAELQKSYDEIKEAMQKGQTLERKRMAADLHDNLGSLLTAINISLDNISPEHLTEREKKIYSNILSMTENAYSEVRILSHNLMPEELEKEGLENALKRMIQKINMNQNIRFELIINDLTYKNKSIDLNIYAICLELIQNIIKHSRATESQISLFEKANTLWLEVRDNGRGIHENQSKGIGLKNIQSRLESMGGELVIDSENDKGTRFVVSVPLTTNLPLIQDQQSEIAKSQ
jgi:two-component system, NarL family, sensor histidine kinase FusK